VLTVNKTMMLLALLTVAGCSNALNYKVSSLSREQKAVLHAVLTADQSAELDEWIHRHTVPGKPLPAGTTVDQALKDQAKWLADQQAAKARVADLATQKVAQHAARQQELAKLLSVALVSKANEVLRDDQKFVALELQYANKTDKEIRGVQGVMKLANTYGQPVIDIDWTFNRGIASKQTVVEHKAGIAVNQSSDSQIELWNTDFEKLKFTFEVKTITFKDGTSISDS
jgi:hypothetical protein